MDTGNYMVSIVLRLTLESERDWNKNWIANETGIYTKTEKDTKTETDAEDKNEGLPKDRHYD